MWARGIEGEKEREGAGERYEWRRKEKDSEGKIVRRTETETVRAVRQGPNWLPGGNSMTNFQGAVWLDIRSELDPT